MSKGKVNFILGRAGSGKTHKILTEIKNECTSNPVEGPIFIITPEQMTFHTEYQLLLMNKSNSMIRANVLSFNRLAHRVIQEVGGLSRYHLDEVGRAMLLQKIMIANCDKLGVFAKYIKKPGFIGKMDELFSEFKHYQLDTTNLKEKLNTVPLQPQTKQKITTLAMIYEEFKITTLKQYLTTEDYLTLLIEKIEKSELIKTAHIYIDGYHTFNAQEQAIIYQLAQTSKSITIALTACINSQSGLWDTTQKTYDKLKDVLEHLKPNLIRLGAQELKTAVQFSAWHNETITHLEQNFMQAGTPSEQTENISLLASPSRRLEIEEVAKRIHELTHHQNVALSNIAIYSSNPQADHRLYTTIFAKHKITHFLDYKESMMIHPVIKLLHKIFDIFTMSWNNNTIFTVLKTGLFVDVRNFVQGASYSDAVSKHLEDIDVLENYVLARNIRKHDWTSGVIWIYSKYGSANQTDAELEIQDQLNQIKQQIVLPILEFETKIKNSRTVTCLARAVFEFLEQLEIPKKLQLLTIEAGVASSAKVAGATENQKQKKQHEQVWTKLLQVLEQIVEVAGDDEMSCAEFMQLFKTGLEQLTFATVPPTLDAVQIGDITRSRYQLATDFANPENYGIKHVFIIGVNDGILPSVPTESSLLSEKEREILTSLKIQLSPSLIQSQQDEVFSLYTILATAHESVTLSYTTENNGHPSYIFDHIKQMFPNITVQEVIEDGPYERLTTKKALFDKTLLNLKLNSDMSTYYEPILKYYERIDRIGYQLIQRATSYENQVDKLLPELTKEVYGEAIEASVSRIELFNQCQFAHFMSYGLRLRERDLFQLTMPDIGSLYHEALKYVSMLIKKDRRSFTSLSVDEIKQLAQLGVAETIKKHRAFEILEASKRMNALKYKLTAVVEKTITALSQQGKHSAFKESFFELRFGKGVNTRRAIGIETTPKQIGDFSLSLRGIIDRIDTAYVGDKMYLRVVDYKSGKKELDLDTVYYGLSLQLLTYLDVAINGLTTNSHTAGALYFHVHNPYTQINEEILTIDEEALTSTLRKEQSADYRMTGYLPENEEVVMMSDSNIAEGVATKSDIVPITLKKDRTFAARGNKVLTTNDFDLLRIYANKKIEDAVLEMTSGNLNINPSSHKANTACDWCQFKAVCQFDFAYNKHRNLPTVKPDEALVMIKDKLEG